MRFNPATETNAFASVDDAAADLSKFPDLRSNALVWDCQNGGWTLNESLIALIDRQPVAV
jgi:hypothetical protein